MIESIVQDVSYGVRTLLKNPGFTLAALLSLALGIGSTTAIFSLVSTVLLGPLPYQDPGRLMMVWGLREGRKQIVASYPDYMTLKSEAQSFERMAAYSLGDAVLVNQEQPVLLQGAAVSADLFPMLGAKTTVGRLFSYDEDQPGGPDVVVLSHDLWQRQFNSDPNVVGKALTLNNRSYTVLGVMSPDFRFPTRTFKSEYKTEYWMPLTPSAPDRLMQRGVRYLRILARLKPDTQAGQAQAELQAIAQRVERQYEDTNAGLSWYPVTLQEDMVGNIRPALLMLFGAVGFVLLISCTNVANLLMARAAARQQEIAIRTALGASQIRIVRQLLTESVLLSVIGGLTGSLVALWIAPMLTAASLVDLPRISELRIDGRVLGFAFAVSVITGILFGMLPALQGSNPDLNSVMKDSGRGSTEGIRHNKARSLLVVAEVALSLVLLIASGLLIKSFLKLQDTSPGFDSHNVLTINLSLSKEKYATPKQQQAFFRQTIQRLQEVPGVEFAGGIFPLPLSSASRQFTFTIEGQAPVPQGQEPEANQRTVTPDYFRVMGIPLVSGRAFSEQDSETSPAVVMINETLARRFFAGENPLGKRIVIGDDQAYEIIGVAKDARTDGVDTDARPEYYISYIQNPERYMGIVIRTAGPASSGLVNLLRDAIRQLNPEQYIPTIKPMDQLLAESVARRRFNMQLLGLFALIAVVLAVTGIYGVMAYSVNRRRKEVGIRKALGAQDADILKLIIGEGMILSVIGVGIGLAAAFVATRYLESLLFGVATTDLITFAVMSLLLIAVTLIACYIPARRALKVNPTVVLRS